MGTNGTDIAIEPRLDEEILVRTRVANLRATAGETEGDFALAPLVDKIAYGIARGLIVAVKELEQHIASETRKVSDMVDRRLDIIQASLQDLGRFVVEQQSTNTTVEDRLQHLTADLGEANVKREADVEGLRREAQEFSTAVSQRIDSTAAADREADAQQTANLAALKTETNALSELVSERIESLSRELSVQQEDIAGLKAALMAFSSRMDSFAERLDRQADAVRSMYTAYSQRETELEQLVDGLARLRAQPTPLPANAL